MNINWSNNGIGGRPAASASAPPHGPDSSQDPENPAVRYEASIRSPEQERISAEIYKRLKAGASVDDLKPVIDRLRTTVIDHARRSDAAHRARRRG